VKLRRLLLLSAAIPAFAPAFVQAQAGSRERDEIIVSALALETSVNEAETPVIVLTDDDLHHRAQATLGETLAGEPGVSFDNFGGGASRPVIRGQTSPRVEVLSNGAAIQDASEISPDHAVVAEPLLLRGIEVLRGPATLRFGGGAIGGAVNLLDEKVPTGVPESGLTGVLEGRLGTADDERSLVGGVTLGVGPIALRAEGVDRSSSDYDVPDEFGEDVVHGSYNDTSTYTFGGSWVGEDGFFGAAYTNHSSTYGLPGHEHEYEGCHPHGTSLHCGSHSHQDEEHDHDHEHEHEEVPFVNLRSERIDVRGEYGNVVPGLENIAFRYAHTDYEHDEVEEDVVATTFRNKSHDARLELTHAAIGPFRGVLGGQISHTDFSAEGEEAFLAPTKTQNTAVFLLESARFGPVRLDLAARQEWQRVEAEVAGPYSLTEHNPFSVSAGAVWDVTDGYSVALSLARSQRAPNQQELYANGIHLATNTFEIGMLSRLPSGQRGVAEEESSNSANLTLRKTDGPTTFTLGLFHQDFDNYIYAQTLDRFEDFRLIRYTGAEATFTGVDGEIRHQFSPEFAASVFGDYVRAELKNELGNVPRIPPARLGATIEAEWDRLSLDAQYFHAFEQDDIAEFEAETPGYDMLNATIAYRMDLGDARSVELFARGTNLFDELAFNHASFIKNASPLRGRNVVFGLRTAF
jgi:iron complex outermembrane receptor protein